MSASLYGTSCTVYTLINNLIAYCNDQMNITLHTVTSLLNCFWYLQQKQMFLHQQSPDRFVESWEPFAW